MVRFRRLNISDDATSVYLRAAGIIYFVAQLCRLNVSKKRVSYIGKISEVTINKCFKKLYNIRKDLIPKCLIDKYKIK